MSLSVRDHTFYNTFITLYYTYIIKIWTEEALKALFKLRKIPNDGTCSLQNMLTFLFMSASFCLKYFVKKSYVFQAHSFGAGKYSMSNKISTSKQYLGSTQTVNLKNQENQVW